MVEAGLIERVPSTTNRRMVTLTLTEKGQERAERIREVEQMMYRMITELLGGVSLPDIQALLWRFIEGRQTGDALARRTGRCNSRSSVDRCGTGLNQRLEANLKPRP